MSDQIETSTINVIFSSSSLLSVALGVGQCVIQSMPIAMPTTLRSRCSIGTYRSVWHRCVNTIRLPV
jgi:hypothetical protein